MSQDSAAPRHGRVGKVAIERIDAQDVSGPAAYVAIRNAVTPEDPTSLEIVRWERDTYPGEGERLLGTLDGQPVGVCSVGRVRIHGPDYERYWIGLWVLGEARRRGIGTALYDAASAIARAAGKTGFQTEVIELQADGLAFLVHRGFVVTDRSKAVSLALRGLPPPTIEAPTGIQITTLADRPDLSHGVHAVAVEALADIPTSGPPIEAGSYEAWLARDVEQPGIPADAFAIALDRASGEVVGYACLQLIPGSSTRAWNDMTAVRRAWRGRGIASALKRATIRWAIEHGLEAIETANDENNLPMRAVNARLGYRPTPDWLSLRGPLSRGA